MSKLVEKVKSDVQAILAPAVDPRAPYAKVMIDAIARAAIAAVLREMREPSEAALIAGFNAATSRQFEIVDWATAENLCVAVHRAMISAFSAEHGIDTGPETAKPAAGG